MTLPVFVPIEGTPYYKLIDKGSGIVEIPERSTWERAVIYFEGNRFKASNIRTFANKCYHAASRGTAQYLTVATAIVLRNEFILVGHYDIETKTVDVINAPGLCRWCDWNVIDSKELVTSE